MSKNQTTFGIHAVNSILERQPERFIEVFVLKGRQDERMEPIINQLRKLGVSVQFVHRKALDERSQGEQHQGVVAIVKAAKTLNESDLDDIISNAEQPFLLILDGVTDPHNLGACLRTADAAGVNAVVVPKDKSVGLNPTVSKVACGAAETVPLVQVTNLARTMRDIQQAGLWIIGTAGEATQDVYRAKLQGPIALAMGAEGKGLRRLTREHCDELISIPMAGSVSSLNVSVATGVCLFEIVRQRIVLS
jgi:23S rRNA (guanosine2251-2'-O)-methyltransferase